MRRRRARPRLDMLPLLDVFMVILFVFATIQERELGDRARQTSALTRELQGAQQRLTETEAESKERLAKETSAAKASMSAATRALDESRRQAERARKDSQRAREKLDAVQAKAQRMLESQDRGRDAARRDEVLSKLLDQFTVFEVEIVGERPTEDEIHNHCCYRAGVFSESWRSCGDIPEDGDERRQWSEDGLGGLEAVMRRTHGGNALTIIRQDSVASFKIGGKLETLLRDRFPEHKVYDDGIAVMKLACTPGAN